MRLMVLKAAKAMDVLGNKEARIWVSMIKAMVPEKVCKIIDQAMQVHGATGIASGRRCRACTPQQRTLRYADGPDEVHHHVIARAEVKDYQESNSRTDRRAQRDRHRPHAERRMSLFDLTGKVALLTGASKGMGLAMATALAEHGATVVISARKQDQLDAAAEEINALGKGTRPCGGLQRRLQGAVAGAGRQDPRDGRQDRRGDRQRGREPLLRPDLRNPR